jgi:SAM-dependent methyltransferase
MRQTPDFDALYGADPDPWRVESSWYEQRKRDVLVAGLRQRRYGIAWDPACGAGVLAAQLSSRCDRVIASDRSASAVERARRACAAIGNVGVVRLTLPDDGRLLDVRGIDLVVLSELLYYLGAQDRADTFGLISDICAPHAEVVAVSWRHEAEDAWLSGAAANAEFMHAFEARGWRPVVHHAEDDFVLDAVAR